MAYRVIEVFDSIQGEGPIAGTPCTFVRFAGCNLRCEFCDTAYAREKKGRMVADAEVVAKLKKLDEDSTLVFTGGEPLLHQPAIQSLLPHLPCESGVWFETNGTLSPDEALLYRPYSPPPFFVVSPKPQLLHLPILEQFADSDLSSFKFVIGKRAWEVGAALELCDTLSLSESDVWFMPEGATRAEQLRNMGKVWEACVKHGVNFSARLHTLAFDKRRGV